MKDTKQPKKVGVVPKIDEDLRNAARGLDIALTDRSQKEESWFFEQFKRDERIYYKNLRGYDERLERGEMTEQFPKGLQIHPLSLLLIRAMTALGAMDSRIPYYFWRSYLLFIFWSAAIREAGELKGFGENPFRRLRDPKAFAGAMFEALVAFCLKRTFSVDVAFGDDPPDLIISTKKTGHKYALECKMLSGLTDRQRAIGKLEYVFSYRVLSFLRKSPLSVFVWWTFDSIPKEPNAAKKVAKSAINLCQAKRKHNAPSSLAQELEGGLGRIIVIDLPKELMLCEDKTGDPRPPLHWRPAGVPERGEIYYNRQTQLINGRIVTSARTAVHLAQNPALKRNLLPNLDVARKQLRCVDSIGLKKVAVIGLRMEATNRLEEAKSIVSSYLAEHGELSGIYLVTSLGSPYTSAVVDCTDYSRVGLNSARVHLIGITRPGCDDDVPIKENMVWQVNKRQIGCLFQHRNASDYLDLGNAEYRRKSYQKAMEYYDKEIELKPDDAKAWVNKGAALGRLGRREEAVKAFDKAIHLKPDDKMAWVNKGIALAGLTRYEEALKAYDKTIELKPDDTEVWVNKGVALDKLSRYEEAIKAFDKAIELNPDYAKAWYHRGRIHALKGNKEGALRSLSKAIEPDAKYKEIAKKDRVFKNLWNDEDFKRILS